jgi:hypothetical protein
MKAQRPRWLDFLASGSPGAFRSSACCHGNSVAWWRLLLEGAGTGAEGQDVPKSDAPVDYIGEAGTARSAGWRLCRSTRETRVSRSIQASSLWTLALLMCLP